MATRLNILASYRVTQSDQLEIRTSSFHDAAGLQTLRRDARNVRTTYGYDAVSCLTSTKYTDGSRVTMAYGSNGNRTKLHDSTGRYSFIYDSLDRVSALGLAQSAEQVAHLQL